MEAQRLHRKVVARHMRTSQASQHHSTVESELSCLCTRRGQQHCHPTIINITKSKVAVIASASTEAVHACAQHIQLNSTEKYSLYLLVHKPGQAALPSNNFGQYKHYRSSDSAGNCRSTHMCSAHTTQVFVAQQPKGVAHLVGDIRAAGRVCVCSPSPGMPC